MYGEEYGIYSDLMNGYSWDTTLNFIRAYSGDTNYVFNGSNNSNTSKTGVNGDEKNNINDMWKGLYEWSTESYTTYLDYKRLSSWSC